MISIVTPSLNQGAYLEAALDSVLGQGVPVEYVVVDGGSTDGSKEILERYADRLAAWRSEPDDGQYDALNKGFALTTGEIMAWLNADDFYLPGALSVVQDVFAAHPTIDWIVGTAAAIANEHGQVHRTLPVNRISRRAFERGFNLPRPERHSGHFIPQESVFWRRSLWERAGGRVDAGLDLAGDFELWARFYRHAELWGVRALLGCYRVQPAQKTRSLLQPYIEEGERVLAAQGLAPFGARESRLRRTAARRLGGRIHRMPTLARNVLEARGLAFKTRELVWTGSAWSVSSDYFV